MDAYMLITPRKRLLWSSGLTIVCWLMATIPATAAAAPPTLHTGAQRYRDSAPPATGRSGSATLAARALLGRSGETLVEVSTATLDSATLAPGNISRLQIKLLDDKGRVRGSQNHNRLSSGGRLQFTLEGLGRGQPLQLQANIEGIDYRRTDVVTLQTRVRRRPDLAVRQLSAPETVQVGTPVALSALVEERSGDTGAEADCVLKVDGLEVDRAPGVWVDAASAVSCAFTHTFSSGGAHELAVEVLDVVPADDDASNNRAVASVWVEDSVSFYLEASVDSSTERTVSRQDGWYTHTAYPMHQRAEWSQDTEHIRRHQTVLLSGLLSAEVSFPLTAFTLTQSSGGVEIPGLSFYELELNGLPDESCLWEYDPVSSANLTLCSGPGYTSFLYVRYGGEVTYYSQEYRATWTTDMRTGTTSFSDWSHNVGDAAQWEAEMWSPGSTYDLHVQLIDGATTYQATASVMLIPYLQEHGQPTTCTGSTSPNYSTQTCTSSKDTLEGVQGVYTSSTP
jgi:hypothetical protein